MKTKHTLIYSLLALQLSLTACSSPATLSARIGNQTTAARATLVTSASGLSLRVIQTDQLPEFLRNASEIRAILDNSNTTYPVGRNADGSLSIPLPAGRQPDSQGLIELLLSDSTGHSSLVRFDTGPLLKLAATPIAILPGNQVVLGSELSLTASFEGNPDLTPFVFSWSAATSAQGPFVPLSGNAAAIHWTPSSAGNYFLRLEMRDTRSGASSTFNTPSPAVFVAAADQIVIAEPADGRILAGDKIRLHANIAEVKDPATPWQWSYSQSPVGPFQPIGEQGAIISWEAPAAGSYYLRLQTTIQGKENTYTTSRPAVLVSNADEVISINPASGGVTRGQVVSLSAKIPNADPTWRHLWSYAASAAGPFTAIPAEGSNISWQPDTTGEFFLRVRVINSVNGEEKTYTSSKVLLSVRDSDDRFVLSPSPANLVKGQSLQLGLKDVSSDRSINWYYAATAAGPFNAIPGSGQNARWAPPSAGTFYLRAEVTGGNLAKTTYTSASALVSVSEASGVISASPEGSQTLGRPVRLNANLPEAIPNAQYAWSLSPSPVGPWQVAQTLDADPRAAQLNVYPSASGSYYVKVDVTTPNGILSFVSPRALVFVAPSRDFFSTNPSPATIGTEGAVTLNANFQPPDSGPYTYVWSSSLTSVGPFTALGGSISPHFSWVRPGVAGNYFVKLDVIAPNRRGISLVSTDAIVFAGESSTAPTFSF